MPKRAGLSTKVDTANRLISQSHRLRKLGEALLKESANDREEAKRLKVRPKKKKT